MHETHLIQPIIKGIAEHSGKEGAKKVTCLRLKVGQFLGLKNESIIETFNVLAKGTILEGAKIEITDFPGSRIEVISFDIE